MDKNRNTLFIGHQLFHFSALSSTNDYASELVAKSRPAEGTVISTYHQARGRGQFGTVWEAAPDAHIAFTTILYPVKVPPREQFLINQMTALAVVDVLAPRVPSDLSIKWPNDILLGAKKVCGILIQNTISTERIQHSIIGIGLNVNQKSFPDHLPRATSLLMVAKREFDLDEIREELCKSLESRYLALLNQREEDLKRDYRNYLFRLGEVATFIDEEGKRWQGEVHGVSRDGLLEVKIAGDKIHTFRPKKINWEY